ncbi:MAG: hypothetical protein PHO83_07845 [Geobacteraceae bacterium]|nr:hypothetical protein [Geobacteraceae bacterium]
MDWEKATRIAYAIGNSRLAPLRIELFRKAVDYAHLRAKWQLSTAEERIAMDAVRTKAHDAFIEACTMMSRCMEDEKEDCAWREDLGNDRKEIGDFACYLHLILGLVAR